MAKLRVRRRTLAKRYGRSTKELARLSLGLAARPSPASVHDLRVAIRRVRTMCNIFPKDIRESKEAKRFDSALRSILKATSRLRDIDTLATTLQSRRSLLPSETIVGLKNERSDAAVAARSAVRKAAKIPPRRIRRSQLSTPALSRRLRKLSAKRRSAVQESLTSVLRDESNVEELHTLRKELRKLRYLLEIADKPPPELPLIVRWQQVLGTIHDLDVAIGHLKSNPRETLGKESYLELNKKRHRDYQLFSRRWKEGSKAVAWKTKSFA